VSYNQKHNEANGEGDRDGNNDNDSWNCGAEGFTDDPAIEQLRSRQIRNFATVLLLSRGVPMLLGGDELRRTQLGNNNAYNQDNEVSWIDWTMATKNGDVLRFFQRLIAFRKAHGRLTRPRFYTGRTNERGMNDITWHGTQLDSPGFNDPGSRALAFTIAGFGGEADLHVMMNMFWEPLSFQVPVDPARKWRTAIDTFQPSPHDIADEFAEPEFNNSSYSVRERSVVVLLARAPA
jgi:glycogen operon protein